MTSGVLKASTDNSGEVGRDAHYDMAVDAHPKSAGSFAIIIQRFGNNAHPISVGAIVELTQQYLAIVECELQDWLY